MKSCVLKSFFEGACDAVALAEDLHGTTVQTSTNVFTHRMDDDLAEEFPVEPEHLVKICDAFLDGDLTKRMIEDIGFGMIASERFDWDSGNSGGERVAGVLDSWCSPEIDYPICELTIKKFRHYLTTGEDTFTREDFNNQPTGSSIKILGPNR